MVAAAGVEGGDTRTLAAGITGLAGPAFDGTTVVWAEETAAVGAAAPSAQRYHVMGRRLGGGPAFVVAEVEGSVTEVAVSGNTAAWIVSAAGSESIVTSELPR
jgi:streptogramin lyase